MNIFRSTPVKRRIAGTVLLVWMFALGTGWANACQLQARGTHLHQSAEIDNTMAATPVVSAGHAGAVAEHGGDGHDPSAKAPCNKFCDDSSQSPVKSASGFDLTDPGQAPLVAPAWNATAAALTPLRHRLRLQPPIAAPPIRIRLSRLAL